MEVTYPNGQKAFAFLPDGSGFAYYPSGRPSICVSTVSSYQNRFFFYDDAPIPVTPKLSEVAAGKTKEHLLCALDEFFVGFAVDKSQGKMSGTKVVFTKKGALIASSNGVIENQWKWDRTAQNAGVPPSNSLILHLNASLTMTFNDRANASIHFSCEGVVKDIDVGMKVRRTSSYLDGAEKELTGPHAGRLVLNMPHTTLAQRQDNFSFAMKAKRDLLNPRSDNLGDSVKGLVKDLEDNFDDYSQTHSVTRYLDPCWRSDSMSQTRAELPSIPLTGTESGPSRGFGDTLYFTPEAFSDQELDSPNFRADGIPAHLRDPKTNGFKNDYEVSCTLKENNPLLPRSRTLKISSGRYSSDLQVPGGQVTSKNPSGMTECRRRPLEIIKANDLPDFIQSAASQLLVVFCVREDDGACRRCLAVAEAVNGLLAARGVSLGTNVDDILSYPPNGHLNESYDETKSECRLVKVDMSESRTIADKYKIRTAPFILFFYGGRTVYGGTLGGAALRVGGGLRQLKVLLVEPKFSDQLKMEGVLTKQRHLGRLSWDLVMTGAEAVLRSQAAGFGQGYDVVLLSEACTEEDVSIIDRVFRDGKGSSALVVGMASIHGGNDADNYARLGSVTWEVSNLFCSDMKSKQALMPSDKHAAASAVVCTKPLKSAHLENIYELVKERNRKLGESDKDDRSVGMTQRALVSSMIQHLGEARRGDFSGGDIASLGSSASGLGSILPGQETRFMGTTLDKAALLRTNPTGRH